MNQLDATKPDWMKGLPILGLIWLTGAVIDRVWFAIDHSIPGWDQADYLTGALNYWQVLRSPQWFSQSWWAEFWMLSSKIPPLVYISTVPFLAIFGAGVEQSTIVNLFYGAILLGSVYGLGTRLFDVQVGLWAAAICLLFPELCRIRLDFLIDYPLVAMVTLSVFTLTMWAVINADPSTQNHPSFQRLPLHPAIYPWLWAVAFGLAFGLSLLTKQTALLFLSVPIATLGMTFLWQKAWIKLAQLLLSLAIALTICLPWYRLNWLLILTASKRATIDSAIAEGDPPLNTLEAWIFYLKLLPSLVSFPLLIAGLVGLLLYWKRSVILGEWLISGGRLRQKIDYGGLRKRGYRQAIYRRWWRSLGWLAVFLVGGYLLSSANVNKDDRYITPLLPVLAVVLAQGLVLFPNRLRGLRWGAAGLSTLMMIFNLMPIEFMPSFLSGSYSHHAARLAADWHHQDVVDEVIHADPYLRNTLGVLPSLSSFNQHNLNYFGALRNFQVYGRQVGTKLKQVEQDARSLSWFVIKNGDQGSIHQPSARTALEKTIIQSPDLALKRTWVLPDDSTLYLYRRQVPVLQVQPLGAKGEGSVRLEQVRVPNQAPPGQPLPVTYRWSGSWNQLRSGLVLINWSRSNGTKSERWLHDHAIALGMLQPDAGEDTTQFQVVERLAMLPPANAAGIYTLTATYLNPKTGETYRIPVPEVQLKIDAQAIAATDAQVDLVTRLRSLSTLIPKGVSALPGVFEQISSINQYDPTQDYAVQARQALAHRLQQEPKNLEFAYNLALASVLSRQVDRAIATFERVTQLDSKNPYAYAYLAFVNLYDFRPKAAQTALRSAFALNPNLPELHALNGVAALMQGNLVKAWQEAKTFERG